MEIKTIENRYNKAVASKSSKRYADVLKAELSTPDWIQELNSILNRVPNIQSYEDFEKARQELEALFNKICKKINAPGLDVYCPLSVDTKIFF